MRSLGPVLLLALALTACQNRQAALPPPEAPSGLTADGLERVSGDWMADRRVNLRAGPSTGTAVVGSLNPGQSVTVLGRKPGTAWFAVMANGTRGYVRLDLLRLRDSATPTRAPAYLPKPDNNDGPAVTAAPRGKIETAPIPAQ